MEHLGLKGSLNLPKKVTKKCEVNLLKLLGKKHIHPNGANGAESRGRIHIKTHLKQSQIDVLNVFGHASGG